MADPQKALSRYHYEMSAAIWEGLSAASRSIIMREEDSDGTSRLQTDENELRAAIWLQRNGLIETCLHAYWRTPKGCRVRNYGEEDLPFSLKVGERVGGPMTSEPKIKLRDGWTWRQCAEALREFLAGLATPVPESETPRHYLLGDSDDGGVCADASLVIDGQDIALSGFDANRAMAVEAMRRHRAQVAADCYPEMAARIAELERQLTALSSPAVTNVVAANAPEVLREFVAGLATPVPEEGSDAVVAEIDRIRECMAGEALHVDVKPSDYMAADPAALDHRDRVAESERHVVGRLASYVERCAVECSHEDRAVYSSLALALRQIERGEASLGDGPLVDTLIGHETVSGPRPRRRGGAVMLLDRSKPAPGYDAWCDGDEFCAAHDVHGFMGRYTNRDAAIHATWTAYDAEHAEAIADFAQRAASQLRVAFAGLTDFTQTLIATWLIKFANGGAR